MNQATSYDAISARRAWAGFERGEGVATYESFRVRQRGAGANMSVDIGMDDGAWVRGDAVTLQGLYYVAPHTATINEVISTADGTNPRLDQIVLEIKDHQHDASGSSLAQTRVVTGTPTAGATLDNRNGAAALPASAILLADVLVAISDTSITDAEIRDRRPFTIGIPPLLTDVDSAMFVPPPYTPMFQDSIQNGAFNQSSDLQQVAALMYLPRRIVGATRIRWKYAQSTVGGALTGTYVLGIYDSSGRKIVDTGAIAWTGAAGSFQVRSETIAATTFEPGLYYVLIGSDTTSGANTRVYYSGLIMTVLEGIPHCLTPNVLLRSAAGGATAPTTLLGFTDLNGVVAGANYPAAPFLALSVG
jgi:hypothetical protein